MRETAVIALTTFFATVGPFDVAAVFAALTAKAPPATRRSVALRGTTIATVILVLFALIGRPLLAALGISLAALRASGGILLLLMGIDMVFARSSGGISTTDEEEREAATRPDIAVFPLATPLIAGPGAMGASILLMADAGADLGRRAAVLGALLFTLLVTLAAMLLATRLLRLLGLTGLHVLTRVLGVLLCALAVQYVFDGIARSGLVGG